MNDSSLVARKIGEARRLVCGSPAYFDRMGTPKQPDDLARHDALAFRNHPGANIWRFRKGEKIVNVRASGPVYADDGATLVGAACAGLGVVLVPEWLVGLELANGQLVDVLRGWAPDPAVTPIYALFAPGPYVAPKIRIFVDVLAARFSRGYSWRPPSLKNSRTK